jgi:hypothetical protein
VTSHNPDDVKTFGVGATFITSAKVPAQRSSKERFYLPALLLLELVCWLQRGRRMPEAASGI